MGGWKSVPTVETYGVMCLRGQCRAESVHWLLARRGSRSQRNGFLVAADKFGALRAAEGPASRAPIPSRRLCGGRTEGDHGPLGPWVWAVLSGWSSARTVHCREHNLPLTSPGVGTGWSFSHEQDDLLSPLHRPLFVQGSSLYGPQAFVGRRMVSVPYRSSSPPSGVSGQPLPGAGK